MDELNHDFQALALEGRAMGEVSELVCQKNRPVLRKVGAVFHQLCPNLVSRVCACFSLLPSSC